MTPALLLRRTVVVLGVAAALGIGAASIRAAADWAAASAPLSEPPTSLSSIQSALEAERSRSSDLEAQLRSLQGAAAELGAALDTANAQVTSDTATAEELRAQLAAAKAKLAALEAALRKAARATPAPAATAPPAGPTQEPQEQEHEGGDE